MHDQLRYLCKHRIDVSNSLIWHRKTFLITRNKKITCWTITLTGWCIRIFWSKKSTSKSGWNSRWGIFWKTWKPIKIITISLFIETVKEIRKKICYIELQIFDISYIFSFSFCACSKKNYKTSQSNVDYRYRSEYIFHLITEYISKYLTIKCFHWPNFVADKQKTRHNFCTKSTCLKQFC